MNKIILKIRICAACACGFQLLCCLIVGPLIAIGVIFLLVWFFLLRDQV
jgi:hypothetical protein